MLDQERCMEIRILSKQGKGIKEISRLTGHSRNTVRRYLRSDAPPSYQRPPRASILDPYKPYIGERVEANRPHRLPATVLFREIRALGYTGGERTVRNHVTTLYPLADPDPVVRFETQPGRQLQVDWCVFRRGKAPLSAFVATLGFSRHTYVEFVTTEQFEQLRQCHINAFDYFGGVPLEILYDNMKTVVLERNTFGQGHHRFHPGLWDLGKHFGFTPRLCRPYRAQTKGKVERFNRYLRNSFYYPLQSSLKQANLTLDVDTANAEVLKWLRDVANCRTHKTTGCVPAVSLAQEQQALQALPPFTAEQAAPIEPLPGRSWPVEPLQRSPVEYEQLVGAYS